MTLTQPMRFGVVLLFALTSLTPTLLAKQEDARVQKGKKYRQSNNSKMRFESGDFDPKKPSIFYFGGGNCMRSHEGTEKFNGGKAWTSKANIISFYYYEPDDYSNWSKEDKALDLFEEMDKIWALDKTYYSCAVMIHEYLLKHASKYDQAIQVCGFSTGGQPAMDTALYFNELEDKRYHVSHVTFFDAPCRDESKNIKTYLKGNKFNKPCWVDNYYSDMAGPMPHCLNVKIQGDHDAPPVWYVNSLTKKDMNKYNDGAIAGACFSVIGEGKDFVLEKNAKMKYHLKWKGSLIKGKMSFFDKSKHPGSLPKP